MSKEDFVKEFIQNDKVYTYYKFPLTSNYKSNFSNSLGVLEDTQTFGMLHSLMTCVAELKIRGEGKKEEGKESRVDGLKKEYERYLKHREERKGREREDEDGYAERIGLLNTDIQLIISLLDAAEQVG